ncbi:class I SAM-dependent methyltransferase [Streptomyces sp. NPDC054887]
MSLLSADSRPVNVLDVSGAAYRRAFELFLAGTDEKSRTHARLAGIIAGLERRRLFLDVGAGEGVTTAHVGQHFERTVAVEPNPALGEKLRETCAYAHVVPETVERADFREEADLALLSHVLYYLPQDRWLPTVRRVLGWLAPGGTLLVMLQNPGSGCMRMVEHFTGARFDLRPLAHRLREHGGDQAVDCTIETLRVHYRTSHPAEALDVAEFMLNVPTLRDVDPLPSRAALAAYVDRHFAGPDGTYTIAHTQDLLSVRRDPGPRP